VDLGTAIVVGGGRQGGPCSKYRQLQIGSENSSVCNAVETSSALEALRDALYKSTTTTTTLYHYY